MLHLIEEILKLYRKIDMSLSSTKIMLWGCKEIDLRFTCAWTILIRNYFNNRSNFVDLFSL